jgi:hypothetical protein
MKYYIALDDKKDGPYTLEEVKGIKISRDTLVWKEGMENWQAAKDFEEFKDLFLSIPPPIPDNFSKTPRSSLNKGKIRKLIQSILISFLISISISLIALTIYFFINRPVYVSDEIVQEGKKLQWDLTKEEPRFIGRYIPDNCNYCWDITIWTVYQGNINEIVRKRFQEDLLDKAFLFLIISFPAILLLRYLILGFKWLYTSEKKD